MVWCLFFFDLFLYPTVPSRLREVWFNIKKKSLIGTTSVIMSFIKSIFFQIVATQSPGSVNAVLGGRDGSVPDAPWVTTGLDADRVAVTLLALEAASRECALVTRGASVLAR